MSPDQIPSAVPVPLDERQCLRLLTSASVGRVVYTVGALPAVLPTRYRFGSGGVLLRAPAGSELVRAVAGSLVAFETGEVHQSDGSGWTVTVLGRAEVAEDPAAAGSAPAGQVTLLIRAELVTGHLLPSSH
ncbi:pyridoxamine 5'-phosphate oxidase family protein [Kitasatospora sp. NBC_00070]|uniref:pyridoxamine 5'-phosphate oxidase family protein n=1 Tax=Kitasatospora sp. NBC_00070 TaxID=2975962 RepID=UPI00324CBFE4